jgi:hypothetical protein
MSSNSDEPVVLHQWSARPLRPIVIFYVVLVFAAFMTIAHFVLHSTAGVKALALAAVGVIVPLVPSVLGKIEYRMTGAAIEKRKLDEKDPRQFEEVVRWEDLSYVVRSGNGFKYHLAVDEGNPLRRFFKSHFSDAFSGEVQLGPTEREEIMGLLEKRGVPTRKPSNG